MWWGGGANKQEIKKGKKDEEKTSNLREISTGLRTHEKAKEQMNERAHERAAKYP